MKKPLVAFLFAGLLIPGCVRNPEIDNPGNVSSLTATTEPLTLTKTAVEAEPQVYWEPGDEIAVFCGDKSGKYTTDIAAPSGTASFKGTLGNDTLPEELDLWAVYPYSSDAVFDGETITTILPSEQIARDGSFGKGMNIAVAHSNSTDIQFYNVGGGIRFSIAEDGVKKVMFEGLKGEIISGRIKIGFKEGRPVVQEVTDGSQFITLLPPVGKKAFDKDTWYYIVAIPGALDGGYKLRFYKDSDYARKVSEKAATVKRSIYTDVEKADASIKYESQTTHFPETKEEWKESVNASYALSRTVSRILNSDIASDEKSLINEILLVDGVKAVKTLSYGCTVSVIQADGLCINFIRDAMKKVQDVDIEDSVVADAVATRASSNDSFYHSWDEPYVQNANKKAIILSPFQHSFKYKLDSIVKSLLSVGYKEENIKVKIDQWATLDLFTGDALSEYDFIFIATHGGLGYGAFPSFEEVEGVSSLCTYLPFTEEDAYSYMESLKRNEIAVFNIDDDNNGKDELFFAITPDCLGDAVFNNTCVILDACHSVELADENDPGSMVWKFLKNGAGIVSGFNNTANTLAFRLLAHIVELSVHGFSFQDAANYIKNSPKTKDFCNGWFYYKYNQDGVPLEDKPEYEFYNLFDCYEQPNNNKKPYYFLYPIPKLEVPVPTTEQVTLTWECPLKSFGIGEYYYDAFGTQTIYSDLFYVCYDISIDGKLIDDGYSLTSPSYVWESPAPGYHYWSVIARIMHDDQIIEAYQSDEGNFTVVEDPGPTTFTVTPAEINFGKVEFGTDKTASFTVANTGKGNLTFSISCECHDNVFEVGSGEEQTLSAGESREFTVTAHGMKRNSSASCDIRVIPDSGDGVQTVSVKAEGWDNQPLTLEATGKTMNIGDKGRVDILSGSLDYELSNDNPNVVNAIISTQGDSGGGRYDNWSYTFKYVNLDALAPGKSTITVMDKERGEQVTLLVTVLGGATAPVPEAVDLGLSVLWSSFNLESSTNENYGADYSWGEIAAKSDFGWSNYLWCKGSESTLTKYCYSSGYGYEGYTDGYSVLKPEDDAAYANLGKGWRMPTKEEVRELVEKCTWTYGANYSRIYFWVTGPNGNSIVLRAKGNRNFTGSIWSSSLSTSTPTEASTLSFVADYSSGTVRSSVGSGSRYEGKAVRPVYGGLAAVFDKTELVLPVGGAESLALKVLPQDAANKGIIWSTSDVSVAAISPSGVVSGVSKGTAVITATPEAGGLAARCSVYVQKPVPVPEAVDLGLPSGTKWASFNLGASKPEEFGAGYAWGETLQKEDYSWWTTYKWFGGDDRYYLMTKYCQYYDYGALAYTDNRTTLEPDDDVAHVMLGGNWRMPTKAELDELCNYCNSVWHIREGVHGYYFEGSNGNSIFIPGEHGRYTSYWTSTLVERYPLSAYTLMLNTYDYRWSLNSSVRYADALIRPVYSE